ncbi:MAG TPA: alpha/beta fold hydrolase [Roseiflexaceae bacterium]|nr:alpha/beta fold hydrolase [Roseiflexaceae bacterium]
MAEAIGLLGRALLFWLGVFELLAGLRRWDGLSWLRSPRQLWPLVAALALSALGRGPARPGRLALALGFTALPAALLQIGVASLRGGALNPLLRLRPGRHPRYTIDQLDIPMSVGHLPALHVAPEGRARAAVCVIHGSGCSKTSYAWRLVDMFTGCGVAVLLIDMDGHGENPRPQSHPAIIENVGAAVGWLRERYGRVGLLGISLGGCLAARGVADGVAVDALAVLEAPPRLAFDQADIRREALALARPELLDLFGDCTPLNMYRAWDSPPIRAAISTWDLIAALDLPSALPQISVPLLALYGGSDAIVKPAQAEQVRRVLPAHARFHLIPRASHLTLILMPSALEILREWTEGELVRNA